MTKYLVYILLLSVTVSYGQISHGGQPIDFITKPKALQLELQQKPMAAMQQTAQGKFPLRFAEPIYTALTPNNSGSWIRNGNQYIWRLALKSEGAKSINLIFDRFALKHGDQLFAYNPDKSHVLGAFTNANNNPSKLFSIAPVLGDEIILELQTQSPPDFEHEILISAVNHDYIGVVDYIKRSIDFGDSGGCNVNAVCGPLNSDEINRSVCKIVVDGSMLCSGTMVNNTSQNGKPYFLTAAHCFDNSDISSGHINAQNIIFYFNFDSPSCETTSMGILDQTISGADVKAFVKNMDFALLEMSKMPPVDYEPYWAGWKRDVTINEKVFTVHHPSGDVKKVSVSLTAPIATTFNFNGRFLDDMHWHIEEWESGVTEGGSSGSGLFTQDQLLIGNLSGGEAYCNNPFNDYYTRLNRAWDYNSATDAQLAYWLDNLGLDANEQAGTDFYSDKAVISHWTDGYNKVLNRGETFNGTWSGHNSLAYEAYAEYYDEYRSARIAGVYISPAQIDANHSDQKFNIKIWNTVEGKPGDELWALNDVSFEEVSTAKQLFTLDEPLLVDEPVFVGVELNYSNPFDTLAIYQIAANVGELPKNTAYIKDNGEWSDYKSMHPSNENGAYLMELLVYDNYVGISTGGIDEDNAEVILVNNPVKNGLLEFTTNINDISFVEVFGLNGSKITEHKVRNSKGDSFAVQDLPLGIYLLKFSSPSETIVKKVLILN